MTFEPQSLVDTIVGEFKISALLSTDGPVLRYRAVHQQLSRSATCHVLAPALTATMGEAFLRKVRKISQVRQRNLIDIFDSGTVAGTPYFLSEELPGKSLSAWLHRHPLTVDKLHLLVQQVGQALSALQAGQVQLSHVSPDNIYIKRQGGTLALKLVGFIEPGESLDEAAQGPLPSMAALARLVFGLCQIQPFAVSLPTPLPAQDRPLISPAQLLPGLGGGLLPVLRRALDPQAVPGFSSLAELLSALLLAIPSTAPQRSLRAHLLHLRTMWPAVVLVLAALLAGSLFWLLRRTPVVPPPTPRTYTVRELQKLAQSTLQAGLRASDAVVREQALAGLVRSSDLSWRGQVEPLLDDPALPVQLRAAEVLGSLGARRAIPALQAHLRTDFDPALRAACAQALQRLGEPVTKKSVALLLSSDVPRLRLRAAEVLAAQGDGEATKLIAELATQTGEHAVEALSWLVARGDLDAQQKLLARLPVKPPLGTDSLRPAELLLRQDVPQARALLVETAKQVGETQLAAAQILCSVDDPSFLPALRVVLSDPLRPLEDRRRAALGIQSCGDRRDGQLLGRLLDDRRESVRFAQTLAGALLRLTSLDPELLTSPGGGVEWAQQALEDDSWSVRESAVALLGEDTPIVLSTTTRKVTSEKRSDSLTQVVSLLLRALADSQPSVRIAAMRSAVKVAQKTQEQAVLDSIRQSLRERASVGTAEEQLIAAASLLRLGDGSQRDTLYKGLRSMELAIRRRAVEEAVADPKLPAKLLLPLLSDGDLTVRFGAAAALLGQGQKPAALLGILREALAHGGVEGVRAYALLQQLGELTASDESKGPDLGTLLASSDVLQRLMAIDALQKLPTADAAPLLLKATRDPDATVRFRLVEVVAYHCTGSKRAALPALRALTEDSDIAVRARATAVLGQLQLVESSPKPESDERPATVSQLTGGEAGNGGEAASGPVEIQAPQSPEAVRIRQAIEQQFSLGSSLFKQGNYRAAQKALEKTSQLCGARRSDVARCSQLNSNLAYQLGVVYENLGQLANAMTEYQKVVQGAGVVRSATKRPQPRAGLALHDAAQQGVERLRGKLGRLILYKTLGGKCQKVEVYMPPGKHQVSVGGGQRKPVDLDAGESVELKTCP